MAHYLVGADDTSFFKKRTTWDFVKALKIADDGDVIKLEEDYSPFDTGELEKIVIEKNITIRGHRQVKDGNLYLTNALPKVIVKNNAQVTLENLTLRDNKEKSNILNIKGNSTVTLQTVLIENLATQSKNLATQGEIYPIIYFDNQSTLHMKETTVRPGNSLDKNNSIYGINSTLNISDSHIFTNISVLHTNLSIESTTINVEKNIAPIQTESSSVSVFNSNIKGENNLLFKENSTVNIQNTEFFVGVKAVLSELLMKETRIENYSGNAFSGHESTVNMETVFLEGGLLTDKNRYPCALFKNSIINLHTVEILQPNYTSALDLSHSKGKIDSSLASSVSINHSTIHFEEAVVNESLFVNNHSNITANYLEILGIANGKVNINVVHNSSFHAEEILIGRETTPNIVIDWTVDYNVKQTKLFSFDEETQYFKEDANGYLQPIDKEIEPTYRGEKPALQRLNELIGIENVKEEVESFIAVAELNRRRIDKDLESTPLSLHSLFLGNPGTGKTSVARLIGELLFEIEVVSTDNFVEVSRSDLVGTHIGQTAPKTRKVLESALGGVLFIDEAYTLSTGSEKDFGIEAINEMLKFMEDHRSEIVIIFAGYTNDMKKFLEMNDGLKSRIPNHFHFQDYSIEDLVQIGLIGLYKEKYTLNVETYRKLINHRYDQSYDQSNGRWIRNLNDLITRKIALRIMKEPDADINVILDEDLIALMD